MPEKRKLTLSVDSDAIEKAKQLGINISEITENVLRSFTFRPSLVDKTATYQKYQELFGTMRGLLKDFGVELEIGRQQYDWDELCEELFGCQHDPGYTIVIDSYFMRGDGSYYRLSEHFEQETFTHVRDMTLSNLREIGLEFLYQPKEILSKFITALSNAKDNRERLEELEMAIQIVEAITQTARKKVAGNEYVDGTRKEST